MMTDPLTWSPINRAGGGGTQVRIHFSMVIWVFSPSCGAAIIRNHRVGQTACWLGCCSFSLAVHEFGHGLMAWWLGCEPEDVRHLAAGQHVRPDWGRAGRPTTCSSRWRCPMMTAAMVILAAIVLHFLTPIRLVSVRQQGRHGRAVPPGHWHPGVGVLRGLGGSAGSGTSTG